MVDNKKKKAAMNKKKSAKKMVPAMVIYYYPWKSKETSTIWPQSPGEINQQTKK
jgi:hypothetical protein